MSKRFRSPLIHSCIRPWVVLINCLRINLCIYQATIFYMDGLVTSLLILGIFLVITVACILGIIQVSIQGFISWNITEDNKQEGGGAMFLPLIHFTRKHSAGGGGGHLMTKMYPWPGWSRFFSFKSQLFLYPMDVGLIYYSLYMKIILGL